LSFFNMGSILSWYAFKNTPKPTVVTGVLENVTDSLTLHVRVFTGSHPTLIVLYCYGNLETVERQAGYLQLFVTFTGVTVVAFDYPGFGASPGKPTEGRLNHAGVAMLDWIERRFPDPNRKVIVWGRSLGTTVATYIASNAEVHGVLLESPLCSGFRYGLNLNISGGCFDFFDTLTRAKNDASEWGKILIIHGKEDTEIRIWQAELLAEVCTENNPATTFMTSMSSHLKTRKRGVG
jgi:hypothetical protein